MTAADVYVALALGLLALLLWYARRLVGAALRLLPAVAAVGGSWLAFEIYRLGEQMSWDSPGSPAILIVWAALGTAVVFGVGGWIAVVLQVRSLLSPAPARSRPSSSTPNRVAVAIAIVCVVGGLGAAYRYYREHQPSHDAAVQLMTFARDGALYSLDRSGVLKKWYAERALEADRWTLPDQGSATALVASGDGRFVAVLVGDRLGVWRLDPARAPERVALSDGALAAVAVDESRFALLARNELSVRAWHDAAVPLATATLPGAALGAASYGAHGVVVGLADATLAFYEPTLTSVERRDIASPAPLRAVPRALHADRSGRFIAVSDGGTSFAVLDLQTGGQNVISLLSPASEFAISGQNQLLIAQLVDVRSYDLAGGSSEPLFNHGGTIGALAASPLGDTVAIADRENIWLRNDSRAYSAPEVRLKGAVQVARLADAVLPGVLANFREQ
jgi:hypothetical protein